MSDTTDGTRAQSTVTRRRLLGGVAAGVTAVGVGTQFTGDASAQADVTGEFDASGAEATLSDAPEAITVSATGTASVETSGTLDQIRVTLQADPGGVGIDDLAEASLFEGSAGEYDLSGGLIADHRDADADLFVPASGSTRTTDVRIRAVAAAIVDGSVAAEASAEETVGVTVTHEGVVVGIDGTADVTIDA